MACYGIKDYIPMDQLIVGRKYKCCARNFEVGTWNGKGFDYLRTKFGQKFMDEELHWDADDHYGTVKPLELLDE